MKKRILAAFMAAVMCALLCACGAEEGTVSTVKETSLEEKAVSSVESKVRSKLSEKYDTSGGVLCRTAAVTEVSETRFEVSGKVFIKDKYGNVTSTIYMVRCFSTMMAPLILPLLMLVYLADQRYDSKRKHRGRQMFTSPLPWRVCKRSDNKSRERFAPCFCCSGLVSAGHDLEFQHALCCGGDGGFYAAARRHLIRHGFAVPPLAVHTPV